jgi:hypothetical protein
VKPQLLGKTPNQLPSRDIPKLKRERRKFSEVSKFMSGSDNSSDQYSKRGNIMKKIVVFLIVLGFLLGIGVQVEAASVPVLQSFTGVTGVTTPNHYVEGYRFTAESDLYLTALGFYDFNNDGLSVYHQVGVFDDGGALLDIVILFGQNGTLVGNFRYLDLDTPLLLNAGSDYYIAARIQGDFVYYVVNDIVFDPRITYIDSYYTLLSSPGFAFPTTPAPEGYDYVCVNALIDAVPIPGAVWLFGSGFIGLLGFRKKLKS